MSDTPRMKAAQMAAIEHMTGDVYRVGCDIERELTTANERIQRLEEDLMDAKNQYAVLVADVVLYEDRGERIKRLEDIISRAAYAFFRDGSDIQVANEMLTILEEVRKL